MIPVTDRSKESLKKKKVRNSQGTLHANCSKSMMKRKSEKPAEGKEPVRCGEQRGPADLRALQAKRQDNAGTSGSSSQH